jgi:glycosyltransferase involved in cell wall biosynthesis
MLNGKKIVVIMPAYNAAKTLQQTYYDLPHDIVDEVILTDDASHDNTVDVARRLGLNILVHENNSGYGANQKTCYREALKKGADIIVMVHPDYQYTPKLVTALSAMIAYGVYDAAIASRIIGNGALRGGMPFYKYVSNRFLTLIQNILIGQKLSEYHTGYRAFSREIFDIVPLRENSDDFIFDNQMLVQIHYYGFRIGEISCPTKYFPEASSINFTRSLKYGLGVLFTSVIYRLVKFGLIESRIFPKKDGSGDFKNE